MGLFDTLFGRKITQDTSAATSTSADKTTKTQSATEQTTAQGTTQATRQTTLDPEVQKALAAAITGLDLGGQSAAQSNIGQLISSRAIQSEGAVTDNIAAILSSARSEGEKALGTASNQLAERTGSSANTLSQLVGQESRNDLEVALGKLSGELGLQGRETVSNELATALEALSGQATSSAGLASVLKGAEVTGRTEEQLGQFQTTGIEQLIEELTKGQTSSSGTTTQKQSGNLSDVLGALDSIAKIF